MSLTTFSPHHLVPDGRAMLSCTCLLPDGWVNVPLPEETYDLDNPAVFLPLLVCMAPYGAVVFSIAARPAFADGTVEDWVEFLAVQNNLHVGRIREARINRMPCVLVDATAVLHEHGDRLDEAEQVILQSVDHIGAYSSLANLYEERCARLARSGHHDAAEAARARAIHWLHVYAGSATSGGEGAALARERDQRIAALGREDAVP